MTDTVLFLLALVCWAAAVFVFPTAPVRAQQLVAVGLILAVALPPLVDAIR